MRTFENRKVSKVYYELSQKMPSRWHKSLFAERIRKARDEKVVSDKDFDTYLLTVKEVRAIAKELLTK